MIASSSRATRSARQRRIGDQCQALAREVVDDRQNAEAAAISTRHPTRSRATSAGSSPCGIAIGARIAERPLASAALANHKLLLPVDPVELLVVHAEAFAPQEQVQTTIAEPAAARRQGLQACAKHSVICSSRPMAVDLRRKADQPARTALRIVFRLDRPTHGRPPRGGRQKFFVSISFKRRVVHDLFGQKLLQLPVLVLQRLQTPGLRDLQAAVLRLPFVERRVD